MQKETDTKNDQSITKVQLSEPLNTNKESNEAKDDIKPVSFFKLECFLASGSDKVIIILAILGSLFAGAAMPLISLLLGKVINQFNGTIDPAQVPELVSGLITNFLLCGVAIFLGSFMMVYFWALTARRLINKINEEYFRVIMKQEQGWFDQSNMFEFATKVQNQIKTIENGVYL